MVTAYRLKMSVHPLVEFDSGRSKRSFGWDFKLMSKVLMCK